MGNENEAAVVARPAAGEVVDNWQTAELKPAQVEALLTISSLLNSDLNAGRVLRDLLVQICSLFRANRAAVFLREHLPAPAGQISVSEALRQDIGRVLCVASTGLTQQYLETITTFYERKEFRQLQTMRRPIFIEDAHHDHRLNGLRDVNKREGFQSMLTLPLMYHDTLIGVMILYHDQTHHYSQQETRLLSILANQAALAITNARLYEAARAREREAAQLSDAGRIFNASLKTREVLNRVVRTTGEMIGNTALVYIVGEGTGEAYPVAFYSRAAIEGEVRLASPVKAARPIRLGDGVIGKALQTDVPFLMTDSTEILKQISFIRPADGVNSLLCVPLKTRGRIIGALLAYQVTYGLAHAQLEDEQLGLAQALGDRAAVAIENARLYEAEKREQRVKDEFLTLVSHELNTPLTNIKGFNHLLSKKLDEALHRVGTSEPNRAVDGLMHYTEVIGSQIDRLQSLIADLSKLPLIEAGQLKLDLGPLELLPLVQSEVSQFERNLPLQREDRLIYHFEISQKLPRLTALADRAALTRILQNLLSNAVKFSPKGGTIQISIDRFNTDQVQISVIDHGIGIAEQDVPRIFERFYKTSSHPSHASGLGIGLYISQSFAEAMRGNLTVNSTEGKGSTFILRLPTARLSK